MAQLPKLTVAEMIDAVVTTSYPREHLGASTIGNPCTRSSAYSFYWASKKHIHGKLNRIFSLGNAVEDLIIDALTSIGINHYGGQDKISDVTGHGGGSIDGRVNNVPGFSEDEELLFEAKSMNHTNFLDVKKKGVQVSKPVYYSQMQMYMGRLGLQFGMFAAMDKNTSDLYFEFIPFDVEEFEKLLEREIAVFTLENIDDLPRISNLPSWYACKFCDHKDVCHHDMPVAENCRTCQYSSKAEEGKWVCDKYYTQLTGEQQQAGCPSYTVSDMWSAK